MAEERGLETGGGGAARFFFKPANRKYSLYPARRRLESCSTRERETAVPKFEGERYLEFRSVGTLAVKDLLEFESARNVGKGKRDRDETGWHVEVRTFGKKFEVK